MPHLPALVVHHRSAGSPAAVFMTNGPLSDDRLVDRLAREEERRRVLRAVDADARPRAVEAGRPPRPRSASSRSRAACPEHHQRRGAAVGHAEIGPPAPSRRRSQTCDRREGLRRTLRARELTGDDARRARPSASADGRDLAARGCPGSAAAPSCPRPGRFTQSCTISNVPPRRANSRPWNSSCTTPRAGRHPLHVARPDPAAASGGVAVLDLARRRRS